MSIHILVLVIIVQGLTANSIEMGGPLRTIAAMAEGIFLAAILWRRNVDNRQRSDC